MLISPPKLLGVAPRLDPDLLPDGAHQIAQNVRLDSGGAEPWRGLLQVATPTKPGTIKTLYRYGDAVAGEANYWFNLTGEGQFARGPLADDALERVYYTEAGEPPKMTRADLALGADLPSVSRLLGLPRPNVETVTAAALSRGLSTLTHSAGIVTATTSSPLEFSVGEQFVAVVGGANEPDFNGQFLATVTGPSAFTYALANGGSGVPSAATGTLVYHFGGPFEDRVFTVCWIGDGAELGPASDPITVRVAPGQRVQLSGLPTTASWPDRAGSTVVTAKRLYQSAGGGFAMDAEVPLANATYTSPGAPTTQTFLPELIWLAPPADLKAIAAMPNGPMVGLSGTREVCFSEPFQPHAWPTEYRQTVDYPHVGLGVFGQSAIVCTTAYPYLISGPEPRAMAMLKLEANQGCVAARSIVGAGSGVLYASPDGLVEAGTNGVRVVTKSLMTQREWQALKPATILAAFHDGRYFGFYDAGAGVKGGFILRMSDLELTFIDTHATAAHVDPRNDALYLVVAGQIVRWDGNAAAPMTAKLRSKRYRVRRHVLGAAKVIADTYPVTFRFYADGLLRFTKTILNARPFRLPSGSRPDYVEIELEFTGRVLAPQVASSIQELI